MALTDVQLDALRQIEERGYFYRGRVRASNMGRQFSSDAVSPLTVRSLLRRKLIETATPDKPHPTNPYGAYRLTDTGAEVLA